MQFDVPPEQITPEARLVEDLSFDSLDSLELVMAVEEEFLLEIDDADAETVETAEEAVELVDRLRSEGRTVTRH